VQREKWEVVLPEIGERSRRTGLPAVSVAVADWRPSSGVEVPRWSC
jgi:hypothetical protein